MPDPSHLAGNAVVKLQCPRCQTRLDVLETSSGGRVVAITVLGPKVEHSAAALETFQAANAGPELMCPACQTTFDPSGPYRSIPSLRRPI